MINNSRENLFTLPSDENIGIKQRLLFHGISSPKHPMFVPQSSVLLNGKCRIFDYDSIHVVELSRKLFRHFFCRLIFVSPSPA